MIRLLQRRSNSTRSELDEIKRMLACLKSSPTETRSAVGAGVNLANADFMRRFGAMHTFCQMPSDDREQFHAKLTELEANLRGRQLGMALGVGLYRIWLVESFAGRRDAAELLGEELTELSRRASSFPPPDGPAS